MELGKRALSALLCLIIIVGNVVIGGYKLKANALTSLELNAKYHSVKTGNYGVGKYFRNDQSSSCHLRNSSTHCHGNHNGFDYTDDTFCNCKVATEDIAGTTGGIQCFGYARYVFYQLFGLSVAKSYDDKARYKLSDTTNVTLVGQTTSNNESNSKSILSRAKLGDFIQASYSSMHSMIVESVTNNSVTVLECNHDGHCYINTRTISFSSFASQYSCFSLYRATNHPGGQYVPGPPTFATISTDYKGYAVDETVNFSISSDGNLNTLWIYCPNGDTLHYSDVGSNYQLAFGMKGHYQALVQAWNGVGSFISDRIDFVVGPPTYATLSTNYTSYAVDEKVTFSFDSDGNTNTLWIYCPNGDTLHYSDVGSSYQLGFGMKGHYQALVQTWNGQGSFISERTDFVIGDPTYAELNVDRDTYFLNDTVTFNMNSDGSTNTLWIYYPDGSKQYFSNAGSSHQVSFETEGSYSALLQTWNRVGNKMSEKVYFTITEDIVSNITVNSSPRKTIYYEGEALDTSGLTLTATYSSGKAETVTNGFMCTPTVLNTIGTQEVVVTYKDVTTSFNVTVNRRECDDCVWVLQSVTTPATCISCGEGIYICEVCGKEKTDEICIDPTCHSSDLNCRIIQKATCEKDGKYEYRCPDCGEVVSAGKLNKKPTHDFTSWSEWEEESNGSSVRHRDCKSCGYQETQYIPGISAGKSIDLIDLFRILFERIFALFDIYLKKI